MPHRFKLFAALTLLATAAQAENIIGINERDLHLISFDSATPGTLTGDVAISGLPAGVQPISIDFRPATGTLILVGQGPTLSDCQLYAISINLSVRTATASPIGAAPYTCGGTGDIDFNPTVDRVRNIGGSDNYRINPNDSVKTQDTAATYVMGDAVGTGAANIGGTAYDRNVVTAGGGGLTTLFGIDGTQNTLVRIGGVDGTPSPNGGQVTTLGGLGVDVGDTAFDISGSTGAAFMSAFVPPGAGGVPTFFTIDLTATSNAATSVGRIGTAGTVTNLLGMTVATGIVLPSSNNLFTDDGGGAFGQLALWLLAGLAGLRGVFAMRRR